MFSSSKITKQNPSTRVKGGGLADAAPPTAVAARVTVQPPAAPAPALDKPANTVLFLDVQPPPAAAHGSGKPQPQPQPSAPFERQGEEDSVLALRDQPQEPVALPVLGGNVVVALVPGIPVDEDPEAPAGGVATNPQQTTVLRKNMLWNLAVWAVLLGMVVVVAVVIGLL